MSEREWTNVAISACLEKVFAGEWGAEPAPANAVVLRATDIDNDGHVVGVGAPRAIPKGKLSAKQMIDGDILLEGSGGSPDNPVGRVALFETADHVQPTICSNFFKTLRPNRQLINERFFWRKLCWFYRQPALLSMQQQTTGIINLKFQDYLAAEITLPADKAEQAKIAEVLDTLDTTIRQTEAIIAKLKLVKQGLLHDLLTRGIDANGELRAPQSEEPHLYKTSPLGWIPDSWEVRRIGDIGETVTGSTPPSSDPYAWGFHRPFVTPVEVVEGPGISCAERNISERGAGYVRMLPAGSTLVVCIGSTIGKVGFALVELCTNQQINAVIPGEMVVPEYLPLATQKGIAQLRAMAGLQAVPIVNKSAFDSMLIPVPPRWEQEIICERLSALAARSHREEQLVAKLQQTKSGLMDDLLTGRVRVTSLLAQPTGT